MTRLRGRSSSMRWGIAASAGPEVVAFVLTVAVLLALLVAFRQAASGTDTPPSPSPSPSITNAGFQLVVGHAPVGLAAAVLELGDCPDDRV